MTKLKTGDMITSSSVRTDDDDNKRGLFIKRTKFPIDHKSLFSYHCRKGALERLIPPWSLLQPLRHTGGIKDGAVSEFTVRLGPVIRLRWVAEHFGYKEGLRFQDRMLRGPLKSWVHTHSFMPDDTIKRSCIMEDRIDYKLPLGPIGSALAERSIKRTLQRLFDYRHYILASDLALQKRLKIKEEKRILITGSSGLIGSALVPFLGVIMSGNGSNNNDDGGSESDSANIPSIIRLFRDRRYQKTSEQSITWDPASGKAPVKELERFDAVIHLAGESLFGRWNESKKQMIRDSRVKSTQLLCDVLSKLKSPPSVLICASAIGYYGNDRGKEILTEQSKPGSGFLSKVCQEWEDACDLASNAGIRVVNMRFGLVLTPLGGFLKKLLGPSKIGMGFRVGGEDQYLSWVSIEDVIGSIVHCISNDSIAGPVNVVSPNAVTASEFSDIFGKVVGSKIILPLNKSVARIAFGELADELLSASALVKPEKLLSSGYIYSNTDLEQSLRLLLGKLSMSGPE